VYCDYSNIFITHINLYLRYYGLCMFDMRDDNMKFSYKLLYCNPLLYLGWFSGGGEEHYNLNKVHKTNFSVCLGNR